MKFRKLVLILVAISMVLSITACGTASGDNTESTSDEIGFFGDKQEEANDDILRGSYIVKQGNWIYYSLSSTIYKSKEDGSEQTSLARGKNRIKSLVVVDDYIYFCDGNLNVVKLDGSEHKVILEEDCTCVNVVDDWLYYGNEYKLQVGSTEVQQIYESGTVGVLDIAGDWMYFTELNNGAYKSISKMKLDGSERQDIYSGLVRQMDVKGEYIYFLEEKDKSLYRMKTDGTDIQLLVETPAGNFGYFCLKDDLIYYTQNNRLYMIKTDGSNQEKLNYTNIGSNCIIINDWMFTLKRTSNGDDEIYRIDLNEKNSSEEQLFAEE